MLTSQEPEHLTLLRDTLRRFIDKEMPRDLVRQWDREDHFPSDVYQGLVDLGLTGLTVAEEYGGSGRDITAMIMTIEELSARSMAVSTGYIQSACYAGLNIADVGSEEQRRTLLPRVATEGLKFSYGFSEPDVGADIASVRSTAVRRDGKIVINGQKRWCSGAKIAQYIYALVRSGPVEDRYNNLSLILVPTDAPGITYQPQATLGLRGDGTYDVSFDHVTVREEDIVGGLDGWNAGWKKLVGPGLNVEKIEVAAMALGISRAAVDDAWTYAQDRKQFGKPIASIQSIRHMLADVKTKWQTCHLMTYHAASIVEANQPADVATAMAKLFVCDTARDIVLTCQQIMGAYGYADGFDMERYVRDILVMPILGGSSAIQKNNIANRLGLPR